MGRVRQRFPLLPPHVAGSTTWKEIKALQDIMLPESTYDNISDPLHHPFFGSGRDKRYGFQLVLDGGTHEHLVTILSYHFNKYWLDSDGNPILNDPLAIITADSEEREGHQHTVKVSRKLNTQSGLWEYKMVACKKESQTEDKFLIDACDDGHDEIWRQL